MKKVLKFKALTLFFLLGCILIPSFYPQVALAAGKKPNKTLKKGDSVWFGNYEQNGLDDGLEPIEWIVVEDKNDKLLLMSKYILDADFYGKECDDYSWKNSKVREFCNSKFYNTAFSSEEKKEIKKNKVKDRYGTTKDKVYIFSHKELEKYFGDAPTYRRAYVTVYAQNNGANGVTYHFIKLFPDFKKYRGCGQWLARDPFLYNEKEILGISEITVLGRETYGDNPTAQKNGIRPVIVVNKKSVSTKDPSAELGKESELYVLKNVDKKEKKKGKSKKEYVKPTKLVLSGNIEDEIVTDNYSYIETKKYFIFLDKNVKVRGNLVKDIDAIIKAAEKRTGFSLNLKNSFWLEKNGRSDAISTRILYFGDDRWKGLNENNEKFAIYVFGPNDKQWTACALDEYIMLDSVDIDFYGNNSGIATFTHELLHCLQGLNSANLKQTGDKLCEGYAAYNEIEIYSSLKQFPINDSYLENYEFGMKKLLIDRDNAEEEFKKNYTEIYGEHNFEEYQLGYALVKFMNEEYPNIPFNSFLEEVGNQLIKVKQERITVKMEINAIKKIYGNDFFEKFGNWFSENYTK